MFSDVVMLHDEGGSTSSAPGPGTKNVCSSEKMTQAGDGHVHAWRGGGGRGLSAVSPNNIILTFKTFKGMLDLYI